MKTVKVTGTGTGSYPADYAELSVTVKQTEKTCEEATQKANARVHEIGLALKDAGLNEERLKTLSFGVSPEYQSVHENGGYVQKFVGYCCRICLKYPLEFTAETLSRAVAALTGKSAEEAVSIAFTVKEKQAIEEELLAAAFHDAQSKAKAIALASGRTLGELCEVVCGEQNAELYSQTRAEEAAALTLRSAPVSLQPDDITASASLTAVWELK